MTIRPAGEDDLPALSELYRQIGHKPDSYFETCRAEQEAGRRLSNYFRAKRGKPPLDGQGGPPGAS